MKSSFYLKSFTILFLVMYMLNACQGRGGSNGLSYDESINDEQQVELLKSQAKSFMDSIHLAGYDVLGVFVDEQHHSVYYAKRGLRASYNDGYTRLPPIMRKNIKTGNEQSIQIPAVIDGHSVKANLLLKTYASDGKILLLSTSKHSGEIHDDYSSTFYQEPIDVFFLDVNDLSFHYVTGGRHWTIGQEDRNEDKPIPFLACYEKNIKIPLSQIFDGSFRFDSLPKDEKVIEDFDSDFEEYEDNDNSASEPATSSNAVSTKSESKSIKTEAANKPSEQVNTAPAASVREEKQTAPQAEQKAKANTGPEFQGGNYALTSYIAQHIHYPPVAAEKKIQGKVIVKVTISATGQVSNVELVQSVDDMLDAEALRLCKSLPRFVPARRNGQPVVSTMTIPINFRL